MFIILQIYFIQGRIFGRLFSSVGPQSIISLFGLLSFIHFNNLLGLK